MTTIMLSIPAALYPTSMVAISCVKMILYALLSISIHLTLALLTTVTFGLLLVIPVTTPGAQYATQRTGRPLKKKEKLLCHRQIAQIMARNAYNVITTSKSVHALVAKEDSCYWEEHVMRQ